MQKLLPLVPFLPLAGAVINGVLGKSLSKSVVGIIGSAVVLFSFVLSLMFFSSVREGNVIEYDVLQWLNIGSLKINLGFYVDSLSVLWMLIVTGIGFLIHVYSIGYMKDDEGFYKFFSYLNLFIFSMLLLVMGSNFIIMFFGWEGVGLCSYLLIGFWYKNKDYGYAARKAFVMNRIGDLGFLLGMFMIFQYYGSLDYKTVFELVKTTVVENNIITIICLLLFVGAVGKSAQIPLFTWLPDAMAGPTPVSALIHAATMVTAGIYLLARCNAMFSMSPVALDVVLWTGTITALVAAIIGLTQNDIKKVLAYSTVSQLGFMFAALGVGAYVTSVFHVTTHAFFKALLFLGAGSVIHGMSGEQNMRFMGGVKKYMPVTHTTMLIGTLAIIGLPPLAGFFSKDEILVKVAEHNSVAYALLILSALLTAIYMLRLYFMVFQGKFRGTSDQEHHLHESPSTITVPLITLAVLSIFGGLLGVPHIFGGHHWLQAHLSTVIPAEKFEPSEILEYITIAVSIVIVLIAFFYTISKYVRKSIPTEISEDSMSLPYKLSYNKFYFDEVYQNMIVNPILQLSKTLYYFFDKTIIDGIVNGIGKMTGNVSNMLRKLQNGNIEFYLFGMVIGIIVILLFNFLI
ncbi:MAG: NADH-quinone oxidoreductase subunit L [Saprospiraceae bacterium]|nr:NADH-quinone oxidoreductase subunit L [Saprospiraceae bacterium]